MIRKSDEDLFEESKMSFGQHLEELRQVLFKALIGVGIGCIFGFIFATRVVDFLTVPLDNALNKFKKNQAIKKIEGQLDYLPPEYEPWLLEKDLAPRQVMLDPGQLVNALREVSPGFLENVDLEPYQFTAKHFDRSAVPELCNELIESAKADDGNVTDQRRKAFWRKLPPDDRELVKNLSSVDEVTHQQFAEFLAAMNRLANERGFVENEAFADYLVVPKPSIWDNFKEEKKEDTLPQMAAALADSNSPDLNRRVNRALFMRQFPDQCRELKLDLIPFEIWESIDVEPQALTATEPFMIWVKAGVITGVVLSSPWIFFQIWTFVASGLYGHERKYVYLYMPISIGLFLAGVGLAFGFVFEPVLDFLFTFNAQMGIAPIPRVNDWLSFVMFLPLGFGLAFQLPLVMLFLNRIGVFSIEAYLTKWRIAVMVIFFLSMILTPADPISMVLLAVPLTLLYFLGIAFCRWMPKGRNPFNYDPESENTAPAT